MKSKDAEGLYLGLGSPYLGEEESMQDLSAILGALSHPSRRAMIARLAKGPLNITGIAAPFDMSLNAVSKHLKVLEQTGLVQRRRQGRDHVITFRREPLLRAASWLQEFARAPTGNKPYAEAVGSQSNRRERILNKCRSRR